MPGAGPAGEQNALGVSVTADGGGEGIALRTVGEEMREIDVEWKTGGEQRLANGAGTGRGRTRRCRRLLNAFRGRRQAAEQTEGKSTTATSGGGGSGGTETVVIPTSRARSSTPSLTVKECKATRTLGVIMGAFTACWLPFFVLALIKPFCAETVCIPHWLSALFLWLGYANSFLNPIIYARFNREFRTPFKEILLLRCRDINTRLRTETYAEQFGLILPSGAGSGVGNLLAGDRRRPHNTSVVAMAAATAVHTVVQYQDALRRASVRVKETRPGEADAVNVETGNYGQPTEL